MTNLSPEGYAQVASSCNGASDTHQQQYDVPTGAGED